MLGVDRFADLGHRAGLWSRFARLDDRRLSILTYHGVSEKPHELGPLAGLHVSSELFDAQMAYLAIHHPVLPLDDALPRLLAGERLPRGAVSITFDDGYRNNRTVALPTLQRHGFTATIFLTAGLVGTEEVLWPDRIARALTTTESSQVKIGDETFGLDAPGGVLAAWRAAADRFKALPEEAMLAALADLDVQCGVEEGASAGSSDSKLMSWDEAREMQETGLVSFGSHTLTHPILSRVGPDRLREELEHSREKIEAELGRPATLIAYPNGGPDDVTDDVVRGVEEAGYTHAVTTVVDRAGPRDDRFSMPRVSVGTNTPSEARFAFQVSGARAWAMDRGQHLARLLHR